jgi:hypothetical protein
MGGILWVWTVVACPQNFHGRLIYSSNTVKTQDRAGIPRKFLSTIRDDHHHLMLATACSVDLCNRQLQLLFVEGSSPRTMIRISGRKVRAVKVITAE